LDLDTNQRESGFISMPKFESKLCWISLQYGSKCTIL